MQSEFAPKRKDRDLLSQFAHLLQNIAERLLPKALHRYIPLGIQFFNFGLVGVGGLIVDTIFLYIGIDGLGLTRIWAGLFSYPFAVTATWLGNRLFTFRDLEHEPMAKQLTKFALVCAVGLIFNRGTYSLTVSTIPFVYDHPFLGLIAGSLAGMVFNFGASKKMVFKSNR